VTVEAAAASEARFHSFAVFVAVCAFILLGAGGLVTSTGSGLSVPDWPLSFGGFFPRMTGGVFFEHGHRMIAGAVALLTIGLGLRAWIGRERRPLRVTAAFCVGAIALQALLGGLTVILRLPPAVSILHAGLAQIVFCLLVALSEMSSGAYSSFSPKLAAPVALRSALAVVMVYSQIILGAVARHTGLWVGVHAFWAAAVVLAAAMAASAALGTGAVSLRAPGIAVATLLPLQIFLGVASYWWLYSDAPSLGWTGGVALRTAHVLVGALLLGACLVLALRSCCLPEKAGAA
jgi:cytochrome c oxidase assembly protein subunit 15